MEDAWKGFFNIENFIEILLCKKILIKKWQNKCSYQITQQNRDIKLGLWFATKQKCIVPNKIYTSENCHKKVKLEINVKS